MVFLGPKSLVNSKNMLLRLDEMTVGVIAPWLAFVPFGRWVWDLWSIWCMLLLQLQFQSHKIMLKRLLQSYGHERHWTTRCVPIPQLLSNGVKQMLDSKWKGNGCYEKIQQDFFKKNENPESATKMPRKKPPTNHSWPCTSNFSGKWRLEIHSKCNMIEPLHKARMTMYAGIHMLFFRHLLSRCFS